MYPNLKLQLWRMGMRQNQLAKLLNVDETMLSKIVNGFRQPSPVLKEQIATALRSDESWLFKAEQPISVDANCADDLSK